MSTDLIVSKKSSDERREAGSRDLNELGVVDVTKYPNMAYFLDNDMTVKKRVSDFSNPDVDENNDTYSEGRKDSVPASAGNFDKKFPLDKIEVRSKMKILDSGPKKVSLANRDDRVPREPRLSKSPEKNFKKKSSPENKIVSSKNIGTNTEFSLGHVHDDLTGGSTGKDGNNL